MKSIRKRRNRKAFRSFIAAIAVLFLPIPLLFPALSSAAGLSGDSRTYALSRETNANEKILGLYEYLDFAVQDLGGESISFHTGGWLRYDVKGEEMGKTTNNDLQYSYLSIKQKTDNAVVNLGRVMVFEGVSAGRVDGLYARTDLRDGFGISAYGGAPVETEEETTGSIYGARVYHQMPGLYKLGISFLNERKHSDDFRKEEGIDLWVHPLTKVDVLGRSSYNSLTRGWMEHTYNVAVGPFDTLLLTTEASRINYGDYFTGTTSAAFTFRPGVIDPDESVTRLGEEVSYGITDRLKMSFDYRNYDYEISGNAKSYGGRLGYSITGGGTGISIRKMDGDTARLNYMEYRVYGFKKIDAINVTVDVLDVKYKTAINGVKNAYSATLAAEYDLMHNLKVGADVEYSKNPDFDKEVRGFVKAIYRFDAGSGAKEGV